MAKKKKAATKTKISRPRKAVPVALPKKAVARKPAESKAPGPEPARLTAEAPEEVLAEGHEWYDDGGNEGLKQRPITEGG